MKRIFWLLTIPVLFLFAGNLFATEEPFPLERLHTDWMFQDHGKNLADCFSNANGFDTEQKMLNKAIADLEKLGGQSDSFATEMKSLVDSNVPGNDPRWKDLYFRVCEKRRELRLKGLIEKFPQIVFTKHSVLGGSHYAYTEEPTDAQVPERNHDFKPGGQLCRLTTDADGNIATEILYETKTGYLRDPDVSYDGKRIVFSMRNNFETDDFHVYEYDIESKTVRQLTDGTGFADTEPCYLPTGNILFASTRCMQIVDCWWTDVSNLYMIDKDGNFLRRIGFDQVHTNYPTMLDDGRVIYTRWDYNDRGQIFPQPLFVMNYDGTGQTEFYGNNSWFPTTIMHARGIPGTQKVVAIASGHHTHQRGKLVLIDRTEGTQEADGVQLICPPRKTVAEKIDAYGQDGDQFQYPYPIDETQFILTYSPEGFPNGRYEPPFGIYYMDIDSNRELLAFDPSVSCGQVVPICERPIPQMRASAVDYSRNTGTYYVQDIYVGPGLEGIEKGTVKSLRIVTFEPRAAGIGDNGNGGVAGGALVSTPVSINNGTWDTKRVIGTVPIEEDGSAYFEVPAQTPVYFQLLDEKGYVVQTMRSWSTLQPGEMFSCIGCHENKGGTLTNERPTVRQALRKSPRKPQPLVDPTRGFSFMRDVQPILDTNCVTCHTGGKDADGNTRPFSLLGNSFVPTSWDENKVKLYRNGKRDFSEAYMNLTKNGTSNEIVNWLNVQTGPPMNPPYFAGAAKSKLLSQFEGDNPHNDVKLSDNDKKILACWIDLLIPYSGDYWEANTWTASQKAEYAYYQTKKERMKQIVDENILLLVAQTQAQEQIEYGEDPEDVEFPEVGEPTVFKDGGQTKKAEFLKNWIANRETLPIYGNESGEKSTYRNLAINPKAASTIEGEPTSFPNASSNSEYGGLAYFAANNAIDGNKANDGHGPEKPSWGPNKRTDLWWKLELGRKVECDKVVLVIRADFPHDSVWKSATLKFSDGSTEKITIERTDKPQEFMFSKRTIDSVVLTDLEQDFPLGWAALTEFELWGKD